MQLSEGPTNLLICVIDSAYGHDPEAETEAHFEREKAALEARYEQPFEDVDVAPGFSLPAYGTVLELTSQYWPVLVAAFFAAKPASDNLKVWSSAAKAVKRFFAGNNVVLGRNAAAALAIEAVFDELEGLPKTIQCQGYHYTDRRFLSNEKSQASEITNIDVGPDTEYLGMAIHIFRIVADGIEFSIVVDGNEVALKRI